MVVSIVICVICCCSLLAWHLRWRVFNNRSPAFRGARVMQIWDPQVLAPHPRVCVLHQLVVYTCASLASQGLFATVSAALPRAINDLISRKNRTPKICTLLKYRSFHVLFYYPYITLIIYPIVWKEVLREDFLTLRWSEASCAGTWAWMCQSRYALGARR